jgi:poly(3-hydroxyoctanoate) depolymerase
LVTRQSEAIDHAVAVNGLRLYTRRRPGATRPPLLLIHGIGGSLESWQPLLDQMPGRDVVMVDSPGAGRSAVPALPIRMPAIADRIAGAVRALGVEQADVLGYSLGGLVAQEVARRHPALASRLILTATIMGIPAIPGGPMVQLALLSTRRHRDRDAAARDIPRLAGGRTARDPAVLAAILSSRDAHPPSRLGYRYQQLAVIGWSSYLWLPRLRVPTLVLHGEQDPVVPVLNARMLARRIPDARLEIVPGAGHMLLFDEPEKAASILERFLAR